MEESAKQHAVRIKMCDYKLQKIQYAGKRLMACALSFCCPS